jgi:hypothetical protein
METEVGEMAYKKINDDHSETVMNQLADSVLGLSDEAIVGEIGEDGVDADEEAERTSSVLRRTLQAWELDGACPESDQSRIPRRKVSSLKR